MSIPMIYILIGVIYVVSSYVADWKTIMKVTEGHVWPLFVAPILLVFIWPYWLPYDIRLDIQEWKENRS